MSEELIKNTCSLFDNQKQNVKELIRKRRCILSDKCGGGKSLSVLYAFALLKKHGKLNTMLVLTPLSAYEKEVWKKDIVKFTNMRCIDVETLSEIVMGSEERLNKALQTFDIIYGKHTHIKQEKYKECIDLLVKHNDNLLVVDEVHAFRNGRSNLSMLMKEVSAPSTTFWGVTATTISRNVEDLYSIVNLVYPWYLGPWTLFRDTYCKVMKKTIGYDRVNKKRKTVQMVSGLKDPDLLRRKLAPIIINGASFLEVQFQEIPYTLSDYESTIYRRIAKGIAIDGAKEPEEWFRWIMSNSVEEAPKVMGAVEKYSSRFLYLQHAADGIVSKDGTFTRYNSNKMLKLMEVLKPIIENKLSVLIYFDYLAPVQVAESMIKERYPQAVVLQSTGEHRLKEGSLTEASVKNKSHVILGTRASAESASYYFINNVIFFHVPTVPSTFIQFVGRITRKNTLFPGNLHCYIMQNENIDLYKYMLVASKTFIMEQTSGEHEANVPDKYKQSIQDEAIKMQMKKYLLWQK